MRKFNILIVEDMEDHINILREFFSYINKPKINPIMLIDGESAYNYINRYYDISLFIFDLRLPDPSFSGDVILRHVRTTDHYKETPIIILTSSSGIIDKSKCFDFGVYDYLIKPKPFIIENLDELKKKIIDYYNTWL